MRGGTSSAQKALFFNLRRLRARLTRAGEDATPADLQARLAEVIGVPQADVALMEGRLSGSDLSLNAPVADGEADSAQKLEFLVDEGPLPDEAVGEVLDGELRQTWLRQALAVLNERELNILRERRLKENGATLEALGTRLGISKERVRQIENRALEKLRQALVRQHPDTAALV